MRWPHPPSPARPPQLAKWSEDGTPAPTARVRNTRGEPFTLQLTKPEIEADLAAIADAEGGRQGGRKGGAAK